MIEIRPMQAHDVDAVVETTRVAFGDTAGDEATRERRRRKRAHLLCTDPAGQSVAVDEEDGVVGAASALRREDLWGLSHLVVRPEMQGQGVGRRLLERALETAAGASTALISSSSDPAALRRYALVGFALLPTLRAEGRVRSERLGVPRGVREGGADDLPLTEQVDRAVRGAPHGRDLAVALEDGARLLVADGGYALVEGSRVELVAATNPAVAAELLRAALLTLPEGEDAQVWHLTGAQQWALPVVLDAGLTLRPDGALCTRGAAGPLMPYLPSGAYL